MYKQRAARQNKARRKRLMNLEENDDVGLKSIIAVYYGFYYFSISCLASDAKRPRKNKASGSKHSADNLEDKKKQKYINTWY